MSPPVHIPSQMRAARVIAFDNPKLSVDNVDVPSQLGPHDVLIQIKAAGLCHSDVQVLEGEYEKYGAKPGLIASHEAAGILAAVGNKVPEKFKLGARVGTLNAYGYCEECDFCKRGSNNCHNIKAWLGINADGAFAEYMRADARSLILLPENIPFLEAAPLFCAGSTIYGALSSAQAKEGQWIAIIGLGGLGHLGVQYAKGMGLKVVAIDKHQKGLDVVSRDLPERLRPDITLLADSGEAKEKIIQELTNGATQGDPNPGVDCVVIATDDPKAIIFAQQFLRKGGTLCDVGLPSNAPFEVDPFALNFKEHTIKGRLLCSPQECQDMVDLHASCGARTHVGKVVKLEEINELYDAYRSGTVKGRCCVTME